MMDFSSNLSECESLMKASDAYHTVYCKLLYCITGRQICVIIPKYMYPTCMTAADRDTCVTISYASSLET